MQHMTIKPDWVIEFYCFISFLDSSGKIKSDLNDPITQFRFLLLKVWLLCMNKPHTYIDHLHGTLCSSMIPVTGVCPSQDKKWRWEEFTERANVLRHARAGVMEVEVQFARQQRIQPIVTNHTKHYYVTSATLNKNLDKHLECDDTLHWK